MKKAILIVVGAYVGSSIFSKKISASNVQEIVLR